MSETELKEWAESHAPAGSAVAVAVLRLFEKLDYYRNSASVLDRALHENGYVTMPPFKHEQFIISDQHEKIGMTDEKVWISGQLQHMGKLKMSDVFDGSTGTPEHKTAGRKEPMPPGAGQ